MRGEIQRLRRDHARMFRMAVRLQHTHGAYLSEAYVDKPFRIWVKSIVERANETLGSVSAPTQTGDATAMRTATELEGLREFFTLAEWMDLPEK